MLWLAVAGQLLGVGMTVYTLVSSTCGCLLQALCLCYWGVVAALFSMPGCTLMLLSMTCGHFLGAMFPWLC